MISTKEWVTSAMNRDPSKNIWGERPLKEELQTYCAIDTALLFPLYEKLKVGKDLGSIREASERYADRNRSYDTLPDYKYYSNPYLPHNILTVDPGVRDVSCRGCRKLFVRVEFCSRQLCRVCRFVEDKN